MTHAVDAIDRTIVDLLIEDGRMSSADIARRVGGITERSVRYRLERLVSSGVIRVSAVADPKALGYPVLADVFIEVEPGQIMTVAHKMTEFECVTYVACSTGASDLSIQIVAPDNADLYRFVTEVVANVAGVRKTTTVLLPLVLKDVYQWTIPKSACTE
jgi:Lrp/AsnC family transcriptional regulator, regulator for asnA, asnC and gidA